MKDWNVVFRADASVQIGTGHVMRCLTLADAMTSAGARCLFICREHPGHLLNVIRQRGHEARGLEYHASWCHEGDAIAHTHWLGASPAADAEQTRSALGVASVDCLIVDHYALEARWERSLRTSCGTLMVIDDLVDRQHDCDVLLDQTLGRRADDYRDLVPPGCTVLAGPGYALLRPEFAALREHSLGRREPPVLKNLLVTMGGVDQPDATGQVLRTLKDCVLPEDCRITVVMGPHAPWLERVRSLAAELPWHTDVQVNVQDMARLMADSDLAIGAAGTTSWERCCLGLPTLMVVLADNQKEGAAALERAGAVVTLGEVDAIPNALASALRTLDNPETLCAMSKACSHITDGRGAARATEQLYEQAFRHS